MKRTILKTLPALLGMAFACGVAQADPYNDTDGFHGYLRAGAGNSSTHGPQSCFGLGGISMSYRLGNECDSYAEFGYTTAFAKSDNGATFVGTIWANTYSPNSDFANGELKLAKAYVEARNLPFMNGGTIWVGKRYYFRPDIHMLDMQYINMNGTGGGLDKIKFGPGRISYAIMKDNDKESMMQDPNTGAFLNGPAAIRQNLIYEGLPVNVDGTLDMAASYITSQSRRALPGQVLQGNVNGHNGWQVSLFHKQDKVLGGGNTLGVQYGRGPGIGGGGGRMGGSGDTYLGADASRLRVFDDIVIQPTKEFSTEFVALWQRDKSDRDGTVTWKTAGVRPVYAFLENFKLQGELGVTTLRSNRIGDTARLTKLTIAPTISVGRDYWSRPELRAFYTYGKWNNAATPLVNAFNNSGPVYGQATSGSSVGLQVEAWW